MSLPLTPGDPRFDRALPKTPMGMAYLAGTGPRGATCRGCQYFRHGNRYYSNFGKHKGQLKPAPCGKYRELMQGVSYEIPHDCAACKYFTPAEKVPAIVYTPPSFTARA